MEEHIMIQFSKKEIEQYRKRIQNNPALVRHLQEEVKAVFTSRIQVPEKGIGNWILYYYCPDCSVALEFNRNNEKEHRCPRCGKIYHGEPFHGAWWSHIHNQNAIQSVNMGILFFLTNEKEYFEKVKQILLTYAKYYAGYEIHGNIPCNGPGKAEAQTLDEAILIQHFVTAYDMIQDQLSAEEKKTICEGLFLPAAEFLLKYTEKQIHNHAVVIGAALGMLGIILDRKDCIKIAVYDKYGLKDQLDRGVLEDGMWYECAFSYHMYALKSFFTYEKFARRTQHGLLGHPNYPKMISCILRYIQEDGTLPVINDAQLSQGGMEEYQILEFAASNFPVDGIHDILKKSYQGTPRSLNTEAFLYGPETLDTKQEKLKESYIAQNGGGLTMLRENGNTCLCFRHGPYAGEHEHFDKLAITLRAFGTDIAPDLGTCGYGAPMHYQYYKNTATHNTAVIDESNQPPVNARLVRYELKEQGIYLEAEADFSKDTRPRPDSNAPRLWKEEIYDGVYMNRRLFWNPKWLAEVFVVQADRPHQIDWVMHFNGQACKTPATAAVTPFSQNPPFCFLDKMRPLAASQELINTYQTQDIYTTIYTSQQNHHLYQGLGPGNPSDEKITYLIERTSGKQAIFCHLIEIRKDAPTIENVKFDLTGKDATIRIKEKQKTILLQMKDQLPIQITELN